MTDANADASRRIPSTQPKATVQATPSKGAVARHHSIAGGQPPRRSSGAMQSVPRSASSRGQAAGRGASATRRKAATHGARNSTPRRRTSNVHDVKSAAASRGESVRSEGIRPGSAGAQSASRPTPRGVSRVPRVDITRPTTYTPQPSSPRLKKQDLQSPLNVTVFREEHLRMHVKADDLLSRAKWTQGGGATERDLEKRRAELAAYEAARVEAVRAAWRDRGNKSPPPGQWRGVWHSSKTVGGMSTPLGAAEHDLRELSYSPSMAAMLARRGAGATDNVARLSHSQSADRLRQRLAHTVKLETERWPGVESVDTDGEDDASGSGSARGEQEDAPPFAFSRRLTRKLLTRSATSSAAGTGGGDRDDDSAAPARSRSKSPSRSFTRRAPRKATTVAVAPQLGVRGGKHRTSVLKGLSLKFDGVICTDNYSM